MQNKGILKTLLFTSITFFMFYILWIDNIFKEEERYNIPKKYEKVIYDHAEAIKGRQLFLQNCNGCHSVIYDNVYHSFAYTNEAFQKYRKEYRGLIPRDLYYAVFFNEMEGLKKAFGRVPPDLSTIYLARGKEYLFNFILNPQKVMPGTPMPPLMIGREEDVARIVAYLRHVAEPPPEEERKRKIMGIAMITYFFITGLLVFIKRRKIFNDKFTQ